MQHSGSFAVVKLAVKIIEKNPANPKQRDTVENEIYCWLRLDHKNCVNLHEVYETPEHYYLFQELYCCTPFVPLLFPVHFFLF